MTDAFSFVKRQQIGILILAAYLVVLGLGGPTAQAQQLDSFASPSFQRVWSRTDSLVAQGRVARSWIWGPTPGHSLTEPFKESPGGQHLVQYFDKARMEINNPGGNPLDPFYVTNGLLVVEMISGRIQTGVDQFESIGANDQRIAGDDGSDAPTYAALQSVASVGLAEHRAVPVATGRDMLVAYINRNGETGLITRGPAGPVLIRGAAYLTETGHNIPDVFWSYLNARGPIYDDNGLYHADGLIVNWVSAFGYPVTEPFWTTIRVSGHDRVILVQAFQRRILTYSPNNPEGWKVEMANVGAQYYTWRYSSSALTCERVPVRGFGRVWAEHRNVQRGLGCPQQYPPFDKEQTVQTAFEPFEHGSMLWISRTTYTQERIIYVFFDDGTFQQFDDTWAEGQPVNHGLVPPSGRYEPVRGFGKVWYEGTGARVRERLGWATAPEKGGSGAYQRFFTGEMYWSSTVNKIWVLYGTVRDYQYPAPTPTTGAAPYRYEVYDDTFGP
jgi:hypothetical protein